MSYVWAALFAWGIAAAALEGRLDAVTRAISEGSARAVEVALELLGLLVFWSGLAAVAEQAGLTRWLARAIEPVARRLFAGVPPAGPAMGAVMLALSANVLGLGNAATPLGIRAMRELQRLNPDPARASPAMCTLLALCTSSITLVPAGVIAMRAVAGAAQPADILLPTLLATSCSTAVAVVADAWFRRRAQAPHGRDGKRLPLVGPGPWRARR